MSASTVAIENSVTNRNFLSIAATFECDRH
jgi:hypothetical protein